MPLLRWLAHTMVTFSIVGGPLAVLVLSLLAAYLGLYWALVLGAWRGPGGARAVGGVAGAGLLGDRRAGRGHVLSGFPWGLLGYVP